MILERRTYESKNPVLYTGTKWTFYRTENGFQVYERVDRGPTLSNQYQEFYSELPDHLETIWEKAKVY